VKITVDLPEDREEKEGNTMRYTNLGKVSYLFLLITALITVWGLQTWITGDLPHSKDGFVGWVITMCGGVGIVGSCMMLSLEQDRI